jgi:hypothetical protein
MDVFSEMATQLFIRFRAETGTSADRGRVQCCQKFALEFFFRAGNVFFGLKYKRSLLIPHGPRVTESYKIRNFIIS